MNEAEIKNLRSGDIILIDRGPRSYFRTVIEGPGDRTDPSHSSQCIAVVSKRRRSQYQRATTILDKFFLKCYAHVTGLKSKDLIGKEEISRLIDMGFNPAREMAAELVRERDCKKRMAHWGQKIKPEACIEITKRTLRAIKKYKTLRTA